MERQFHTQFFRIEQEVYITNLSRLTQKVRDFTDTSIIRFKVATNRCKFYLLEIKYVKMAQKRLDIKLRKKFEGMEFRDFFELANKMVEYEKLLREES